MLYDFKILKQHLKEAEEWLSKEYSGIRTGRAASALVERVQVEAYGAKMPINQVAGITVEDAKTLRISPWDPSLTKAVEHALQASNLGVSVVGADQGVRVIFPELSAERRAILGKLAKERLEQARVIVRKARDEVWSDIQKKERDGVMAEDEKFRLKDEMEKLAKEANDTLGKLFERKEKEIAA